MSFVLNRFTLLRYLWWGRQGSVLESLSENVPSGHRLHFTSEVAVPEETQTPFPDFFPDFYYWIKNNWCTWFRYSIADFAWPVREARVTGLGFEGAIHVWLAATLGHCLGAAVLDVQETAGWFDGENVYLLQESTLLKAETRVAD